MGSTRLPEAVTAMQSIDTPTDDQPPHVRTPCTQSCTPACAQVLLAVGATSGMHLLRMFIDADGQFVQRALARCMDAVAKAADAPLSPSDYPANHSVVQGTEEGPGAPSPSLTDIMVERARHIERAGQAAAAHLAEPLDQAMEDPDEWRPLQHGVWKEHVFLQLLSTVRRVSDWRDTVHSSQHCPPIKQVAMGGAVMRVAVVGPGVLVAHQLLASVSLLRVVPSTRHLALFSEQGAPLDMPFAPQQQLPVLVPCAADRCVEHRWCSICSTPHRLNDVDTQGRQRGCHVQRAALHLTPARRLPTQ